MKKLVFAAGVLLASSSFAQTVTIGRLYPGTSAIDGTAGAPYSVVDITHPARVAGTLSQAVVYWHMTGVQSCAGAFTLQFLRRSTPLTSYAVFATRGPFNAVDGKNVVTLVPPVGVQNTDVIAVTANKPASQCGGVWITYRPVGSGGMMTSQTDLSTGLASAAFLPNQSPNVFASSAQGIVSAVIPAAGATPGAFGSFFRTTVQLTNNSPSPISGKFVYHHYKTVGSPVDPSMQFTVAPRQTASFPDIVTLIQDSGLGSLDIITNDGETLNAIARVYNDQGSAGTNGFFEEAVAPDDALQNLQSGTFNLPDDPFNFRTNLGVRTLDTGATVILAAYDQFGSIVGSTTLTLPPNWFEQGLATQYFGLASTPPNGYVVAQVTGGAAVVYGSVTDNRTNDSAVHYFRP